MTDTAGSSTFGPSALVTPANAITTGRLLAAPILAAFIVVRGASWWTVIVGVLVAGTDGLDGWLARRQGTTRSGAFLDPLADKAVVLGALFTLAYENRLPWAPVVIIALREVAMSAYRSLVGRRGTSIPARTSAKLKTLVQDFAISTCLVPPLAPHHTLQLVFIWLAAFFTVMTGMQYLYDGRRTIAGQAP